MTSLSRSGGDGSHEITAFLRQGERVELPFNHDGCRTFECKGVSQVQAVCAARDLPITTCALRNALISYCQSPDRLANDTGNHNPLREFHHSSPVICETICLCRVIAEQRPVNGAICQS